MINIDFLTLRAFLVENIDFIIGARLQKIQQPSRRSLILHLRNISETRKLYINIDPKICHIAFASEETLKRRCIKIPKQPPMFCMLLRKYLEGCRVTDALTIENDRIFELHFETADEFASIRSLCLCAELMGKHSDIILYDRETSIILGCAHNVGPEKSRQRELHGGLKYVYPARTNRAELPAELRNQFKNLTPKEVNRYLASENFTPAISGEKYTLFQEFLPESVPQPSVNDMLDNYYSAIQGKLNLENEKAALLHRVKSRLSKVNNSAAKISCVLKKSGKAGEYKLYGELLTANLYQKCGYIKQIEVYDYTSGKNVAIELDETMNLNENAQRYFKLYSKAKTTSDKSEKMLEALNMEREYLESVIYNIELAAGIEDLDELKSELGLADKKSEKFEKPKIMKIGIKGFDVYIGRNNKQNDYIVSKIAHNEDYWFHIKFGAGSHVLLKTDGKEPDDEVLFECCKLAKEYSSVKHPSKTSVIYTKAKNLHKPPASPLGYVTYKTGKEVLV